MTDNKERQAHMSTQLHATAETIAAELARLYDAKDAAERAYKLACEAFMSSSEPGDKCATGDGRTAYHMAQARDGQKLDAVKAVAALQKAGLKIPYVKTNGRGAHVVLK